MTPDEDPDGGALFLLAYFSEHPITGFSAVGRLPWPMTTPPATIGEVEELDRVVTADLRERGVISRSHTAAVTGWTRLSA